ncbi:MAG: hypothetical protein AVDCRST_MAG88-1183 [uncultured Thermomicrobiales bacterium]|uniref:Uncharacterized protein n=1 Tax=uncultured Thermomicrobiales bacterium TaxID=1645740 RepID=A0A6J4USG8_9BACT|nr:MAG: hypothetical protein AVDCRST_MAG88-1183 [uncultured Thermomicrobiales bacterium]
MGPAQPVDPTLAHRGALTRSLHAFAHGKDTEYTARRWAEPWHSLCGALVRRGRYSCFNCRINRRGRFALRVALHERAAARSIDSRSRKRGEGRTWIRPR